MKTIKLAGEKLALAKKIVKFFPVEGEVAMAEQMTDGHINVTFLVTIESDGSTRRYVVQRVNSHVFVHVAELMDNVMRVSDHAFRKLQAAGGDTGRGAIHYIRTRTGRAFAHDPEHTGDIWRMYPCIEGATAHTVARSASDAREAAFAFGSFQNLLSDLPGGRLYDTIEKFHDTPTRFLQLEDAIAKDVRGRALTSRGEIGDYISRRDRGSILQDAFAAGDFPERVVHNDAKLSNVLLDDETRKGVCVIDLDTVMSGFSLHDFGDLVRSICNPAEEDENDLSKIVFRLDYFKALVEGYLMAAGDMLTKREIELLPEAGWTLTVECGSRFLADFLSGDMYFRTSYADQNLRRARTQIHLAKQMEENMGAMKAAVNDVVASLR